MKFPAVSGRPYRAWHPLLAALALVLVAACSSDDVSTITAGHRAFGTFMWMMWRRWEVVRRSSIEEIGSLLEMLLLLPDVREKISRNAIHAMAETRTPAMSAQDFMILWLGMLAEPARVCNFASAIGSTPAEWFLSTQRLAGRAWAPEISDAAARPAKGTLAHFESVFAVDDSFARLKKARA